MKRRILSCFLILFLSYFLPACKKIETQPVDIVTSDLIWDVQDKNAVYAQQFLNNIYTYLPTGFNRVGGDYFDAATDDAIPSRNNTTVQYYTNGIVSTIYNPDPYWANSYTGIREVNIFLANIDAVPFTLNPQAIPTFKAEARFIRAMMYFELLKRYGGVPLIGDKIFTLDDNLQLPRNTYADCVNYIISECDAIKNNLTTEQLLQATSLGRITKGAAIALKCRVHLYAASPLFNGGGIESDANLRALTGYPTADPARWQNVINAAEELKALNYYTLISTTTTTQTAYYQNFMSIFTNKSNTEVILAKQAANDFSIESNNAPVGYVGTVASQGRTSPTQGFVDAFPMVNGLPITDPASTYNAQAPYTNRDARLTASVFYNGMAWLGRTGGVQTFEGGLDKPNTGIVQTKTGYYLKKFMADAFATGTSYSAQSHNFIIFRFAEIVLNYAEALNEVGRTEDAVAQIVLIRKRAGLTAGTNARYGIPVGISQTSMRTLIQNERRVELAFEEHRFWDLRRWKLASTVLNGTVYGMQITKSATATLSYQVIPVGNLIFTDKLYHMPLPYDEVVKNANLVQNAGW